LLVIAAVVYLFDPYAAVKAMALGIIAFAAGLLSLPLTSRHRSSFLFVFYDPRVILTFLNSSFAA
jgi:hypothetical protein